MTAAVLSAAVFASSFGPGAAALAGEIRVAAPEGSAAEGGVSKIRPLTGASSLSAPIFSPLAAPPPAAAAAEPDLGGHARPPAAVAAPAIAPAAPAVLEPAAPENAPALAAPAEGPVDRLGRWVSNAMGAPATAPAGQTPAGQEAAAKAQSGIPFGEDAGASRVPAGAAATPAAARSGRLSGLVAAESRARAALKGRAEHLRLLRASADLRGSRPRWMFSYHAPALGRILTAGPKGVSSRTLSGTDKPAMLRQEELAAADLDRAFAAVKAAHPGFKPVRADVVPRAGGFTTLFFDARGVSIKAPAFAPAAPAPATVEAPAAAPAAEAPAPAAAEVPKTEAAKPAAEVKPRYLYEDIFGFLSVHGVKRDAALGRLPDDADAARVIAQISGQFAIPRDEVLKLGLKFRMDEMSSREAWLFVYDRLQAANREQFKRLDSHKYEGELPDKEQPGWREALRRGAERLKAVVRFESGSFRQLANRSYPPGWRGSLLRLSELQKHVVGFAIRVPYHLFDIFFYGYFRQAISFEFHHSSEDFLSLSKEKDMARKWLEAAMRQQSFRGPGVLGGLRSRAWFRLAERWFVTPAAAPLAKFMVRRLTLGVMSAVALGVLGAFAPALPLSFALTSLPLLGPAVVWAFNGLPVLTAAIPFVGHFFAPVVSAAVGALMKELVLGPMIQQLILSTLLTYPRIARERLARARDLHPESPLEFGEILRALGGAAVSWEFFKSNMKSFVGLMTVNAEISGILTYASQIDAAINPGFSAATGYQFTAFHSFGASVDGSNGAITWGSVLLNHLQNAAGYNISDHVMAFVQGGKSFVGAEGGADGARASAAAVIHAAETRAGYQAPFDSGLWKESPARAAARIKELSSSAGGMSAELAAADSQMTMLRARLGDAQAKLKILSGQSRPVAPAERAEYDRLLRELGAKRDEAYARSKFSEATDLSRPKDGDELKRLQALQAKYRSTLPPPPPDRNGYWEQLAVQEASYKALSTRLSDFAEGTDPSSRGKLPIDAQTRGRIEKLVGEIEAQRAEVQAEMTQRDATASLISAANHIRNHALNERRNGQDMLRFHTDFAKLATVMDLALSKNEINAAQAAIRGMEKLLEKKQAVVNANQQQIAQNEANAAAQLAQIQAWTAQNQATVNGDKTSQANMQTQETEASLAATRSASFQQQVSAFLAAINAADKGSSSDAATQYQKDLNMLSQVAQWRQTGNPNDPTAFSMSKFQDNLKQVNDFLAKAQSGVSQIQGTPDELGGALIAEVPGPQVIVHSPNPARMLQILADRQTYWQGQLATYQADLDQVNQYMDPNHVIVDEFGLPHGYNQSLQNLATLHPGSPAAGSKADAQADFAQLDKIASELNAMTGSQIPMLSSLSLADLQTTIKTYGDSLKAVKFPTTTGTTPLAVHQAEMDLILAAQLTPMAARAIVNWSVDQATIDTFNSAKATGGALTVAHDGLTAIVNMLNGPNGVLPDLNVDVALVQAHVDPGNPNGRKFTAAEGAAVKVRKLALVQNQIIPALTQAQGMLGTLMKYQQTSIDDVTGTNSQYYTLFSSDQLLLTQTQNLYNQTLPWSLASFGGAVGDVSGSLASIANWKQSLQKYIDGYTDSNGQYQEGITQYQQDMKDRQCATGCTRREVLYGEDQPYSLPMKISQYGAEETTRASEINTQDLAINDILTKIQTLSKGKYDMSPYMLPTGAAVTVANVQALVDANTIQKLGDELTKIGNLVPKAGGGFAIGGGDGTVPVGTQPSPTLTTDQQIALLTLAAAEHLVPSANTPASATNAPAAYAVARYLYSDAVVKAANTALTTQVPQAVKFLNDASAALGSAIAQTIKDVAYVNSNGASESPDALYARKIAMFQQLDAFLKEGESFYVLKTGWDQDSFSTINKMQTYYNGLLSIYKNAATVNTDETKAINTMLSALQKTSASLAQTDAKVTSWLAQLDPAQQSALRRVSDDVSTIQDKTRAVLEANINWHDLDDQLKRSRTIIAADLTQVDSKQQELAERLKDLDGRLPPDLVRRIEALRISGGSFAMGDGAQPQALVIKKSEFSSFLDTMLGMMKNGAQAVPVQDMAAIKSDLMQNPTGLAAFLPGAGVMNFGDDVNGFYLVYQSRFAVPNGLETGSWVTLGNVAQLWGNNVSVSGYGFSSPPSHDGTNPPYGDKGIDVTVESLQGRSMVNYLDINPHRFGLSIPASNDPAQNVALSRLMIMDDYAVMLLGDKLYVGLTGYGDAALSNTAQEPYYYGGNLKTSLKLTEVMSLNASQQALFANDPRRFLENVNLDFTGYDPSLNKNFAIMAQGDNKNFFRTQVGPQFDVNRLLHPEGGGDTFTVDMFYANTRGTDDLTQQSIGTTIVKGFSIKNDQGKTWLQINNAATGELGQVSNTLGDTLSFTLPDRGITLSAQGQLIGGQSTHYAQISKKVGDNTTIALGYGSQYVGQADRLSIGLNTSLTLAEIFQSAADKARKSQEGGELMDGVNKGLGGLFGDDGSGHPSRTVAEMAKVYEADIGRKLITQDVGTLTRDIQELRKAGAIMDNVRTHGMVGFTSNAITNNQAELAVGGGFSAGSYTELTLNKTQKALVKDKTASLYREGLRLQDRLIDGTKAWQGAVVDGVQAQWNLKLALFEVENAPPDSPVRREAEVRASVARDAFHQAVLKYNAMTGRDPASPWPFADLDARGLRELLAGVDAMIAAPDRYTQILGGLDKAELEKRLGKDPFNLMDWLPWVDRLTAGFGVQYQDLLNGQALTLGASVRLPFYDPRSKAVDHAYELEASATTADMEQAYRERALRAAGEHERALAWRASAAEIAPQGPAADRRAAEAIREYRNGLIDADGLRAALDDWRFYASKNLETQVQASLAAAQEAVDSPMLAKAPLPSGPARVSTLQDAVVLRDQGTADLQALADRAAAADEMRRGENHRIQKFWLDLEVGTGLTAKGLGIIPSIGITGVPVTPVFGFELKPEELRELQVREHGSQKDYYDALKSRTEAGWAVQFYQDVVVYRSAQARLDLYRDEVLPELQKAADRGDAGAQKRLDQALLDRDQTVRKAGTTRAELNLLLGRAPDAPLAIDMDESQALSALSQLLAVSQPVEAQRAILKARVGVAHAVEAMVDKNQKVDVLQLEPVSIVVRSLGRLMAGLGGGGLYNADAAAAARVSSLTEERALEAYDGQRAEQAADLRLQLNAARGELAAKKGGQDPETRLLVNELEASIESLEAGLLALGEDPNAAAAPGGAAAPSSWAELQRRLTDAEQALSPLPMDGAPAAPDAAVRPPVLESGAHVRYEYANQTLGHTGIYRNFAEGWVEIRLKNPNTPPEALLQLSQLKADEAANLRRTQMAGATAQAGALAAEFESDVRLLRWARAQTTHPGAGAPLNLDPFMKGLNDKLNGEREKMITLLGLPPGTTLKALSDLVPEFVPETDAPSGGLSGLADKLIADIRDKQIDSIRRTLFENGLPQGFGGGDDLMSRIDAKTLADRMSYKGFTPMAAAGIFRGTPVGSGFLEAPDPRDIERALENVISDSMRQQLESEGRLRELSLHLHQLMSRVSDGAEELEARRREIKAAEGDLKARTALATDALATDAQGRPLRDAQTRAQAVAALAAAQQRLLADWSDFGKAMVNTKSAFIALVTELEALGQGSAGSLRPFEAPLQRAPRALRLDPRSQLVDYWTERMADPAFAGAQDATLARAGAAAPADARARILAAADLYRQALKDGDAVRSNDFTGPEKLDLLTRNDVEGKRLRLRAEIEAELGRFGALDAQTGPAADLLKFFRADAEKSADAGTADRARKRAVAGELRRTFLSATPTSPAVGAAFDRLEKLEKTLDDKRESLLTGYLSKAGDDPKDFVLKDIALDEYLKAQSAFDAELAKTLEMPEFSSDKDGAAMARLLDGLYDVRASLDRAVDQAKSGRGMAAMDALIMLEETRLRAARWSGRTPLEIDRVAEALQNLRDMRASWAEKGKDAGLEPVYALTRLGPNGERTWSVDQWLTGKDVALRLVKEAKAPPLAGQIIVQSDGREVMYGKLATVDGKVKFVPTSKADATVTDEVIGGADAAKAESDAAASGLAANETATDLAARMKDSDFVAVGGQDASGHPRASEGVSFADAFVGDKSLYAAGRLFFFKSDEGGEALNPLAALSLPPEQVVIKLYGGDQPLARDRFPTLQSLNDSEAAAQFRTLEVSPRGAAELASRARAYGAAQERRAWIEVKLNSYGFARDEKGRVTQLYRTKDDFEAQWKAYDRAERDLSDARKAKKDAEAEEAARKADADAAQTAYLAALKDFSAVRDSPEARKAMAEEEKAARAVKDTGRTDGPVKKDFDIAVRKYQAVLDASPAKKAFDKAAKAQEKAVEKYRVAKADSVNKGKDVDDAIETLARSKSWTLYRAGDLDLALDRQKDVVRAAAPAARGALGLDESVPGGGPAESRLTGELSAAVVDADGRLVHAYATGSDVDAAAPGWNLMSYSPDQDVNARLPDGSVRTKVRISHYEEGRLPVLLSERYLIERLDASRSRLSTANHWAIMPYNWGNIILEIPREVAQAPAEVGGRDLNSSHYLGRAQMYKTEGGEERSGFFRTALGWVDVLNLLPDPVERYFDPSQFPDAVRVNSPLMPGQILAQKKMRDDRGGRTYDVKFGAVGLTRQARQASEDLDAARERTLARFNGGVEQVLIETRRGRAGDYQESSLAVQAGEIRSGGADASPVDQRLREDPGLAASAGADGSRDFTESRTPGALFVDKVSRRVTVYPGAAGYRREAQAMDGYAARVAQRQAADAAARPALEAARAKADVLFKGALSDRDKTAREEQALWNKFHKVAERVGSQEELERRMAALQAEIDGLSGELARQERSAADAARRGWFGWLAMPSWGPNPIFWAWVLALFGLGGLLAFLWRVLPRRLGLR